MKSTTVLTPLEGKPKRHGPHLVLDIESKAGMTQAKGLTRPFMVGVYDGEEYRCFRDKTSPTCEDDCWQEGGCVDLAMRYVLTEAYRRRTCYAHNGGRFDFLHLMPWLQAHSAEWSWRIIPAACGILRLKVWRANTSEKECWSFVDSLRLIPVSLRKAAATFNVTQKDGLDLDTHESDSRWEKYNELDCIALYEVMSKFFAYVEDHLGGEVGLTLPATAMRLYRRKYLEEPIARGVSSHHFIRDSFCGGRVEVFEETGENLYYRDINSSYATAMLEPVPCGDPRTWTGRPHERFLQGEHVGYVQCRVSVPLPMHIPPLPIRWKHKLVFPVGEFSSTWEWSELEHALGLGVEVLEWGPSVWYRSAPILASYAESLYAERIREPVDEGRRFVCKRTLVSLFGKFGQNPVREQYASSDGEGRICDTDGMVRRVEELKDAPYIIPQIAARITARARVYLDQWMRVVLELGGRVYYCDTDSIIADVWLPDSPELGALKAEYPEHDGRLRGKFLAPKMYWLWADGWAGDVKAKGLQRECKTVETLKKLASGEGIMQDRLEKLGSLVRVGFARGPRLLQVPRHWRGYDASKRVHTGGGHTRPLVFT